MTSMFQGINVCLHIDYTSRILSRQVLFKNVLCVDWCGITSFLAGKLGGHGGGNFHVYLEVGGIPGSQESRGDGGTVAGIRGLSTVLAGDDLPDNGLSGQKLFRFDDPAFLPQVEIPQLPMPQG